MVSRIQEGVLLKKCYFIKGTWASSDSDIYRRSDLIDTKGLLRVLRAAQDPGCPLSQASLTCSGIHAQCITVKQEYRGLLSVHLVCPWVYYPFPCSIHHSKMLLLTQHGVPEFGRKRNEIACNLCVPRGNALWSEPVCEDKDVARSLLVLIGGQQEWWLFIKHWSDLEFLKLECQKLVNTLGFDALNCFCMLPVCVPEEGGKCPTLETGLYWIWS